MRNFDVGETVTFVDEEGRHQPALITAIHGTERKLENGEMYYPCCNLVFCSVDTGKTDPYGRQIERKSSISHRGQQSSSGFYWKWADEESNPPVAARV